MEITDNHFHLDPEGRKELAVKEGFAKALAGKLSNKGFLAKAPQAVIQKEEARLKETLELVEKLKKQLSDF